MMNVYHPDLQYYVYIYKSYKLPFVNTDALTDYYQLDTAETVWYLCFEGDTPHNMSQFYDYEEALSFNYMYYDFVLYRLERK